jgi:hypothetical protein
VKQDDDTEKRRNGVAMSQAKAHAAASSAVSVPASAEFLAALRECTAPFRQAYVPVFFTNPSEYDGPRNLERGKEEGGQ